MPNDVLIALFTFCLVTTVTPGPNNMMLLSSGATFGLRRTVPHIFGISGGCAVMVFVLGWCLTGFARYLPLLLPVLHIASAAYLVWLAWRIATSGGPHEAQARARPLGVLNAAAFQWVNPKAWVMVLGAITSFARPAHMAFDIAVIALVLIVVGLPCITLWAGTGSMLKTILHHRRVLHAFNYTMAGLLVLSILPGLWEQLSPYVAGTNVK
jgi:threonine/homoserine/homoserine lactone efflux protein